MSYARATSPIVSSGSLTRTTPPRPDQYFIPDASIDMTRSVAGAPAASRAAVIVRNRSARAVQVAWTERAPSVESRTAKTTAAPTKNRVAPAASQRGRRRATQATASAIPSRARM